MYQDKLPVIRIKHFHKSNKSYMLIESIDRAHAIHVSRISIKSPNYHTLLESLKDMNYSITEFYDLYEFEVE